MSVTKQVAVGVVLIGLGFVSGAAAAAPRDFLGKLTGAAKHLDAAQMTLNESPDDFGGHRSRAVALIGQARSEVQAAVDFAQKSR
jgi:uncharacterized MAPEG superfamily protein